MDRRDIGAAERRRPQTLAAVVALALIVAVGPLAVAGLRLDDLGRAVGRARETLVSTIETILGPRIVLGEPRPQPADARAPGAPASRPVAVAPPATPPAGATADPGPPPEPALAASRVPGAGGGRGPFPDPALAPDPGVQPPPAPQPDEGSLLESLLGLLDVLPSVVLDDASEDSPEATGGPQQTSDPGEAAFNAVTGTVEPLLGPSPDAGQAPAGEPAPQVSAQAAMPQPPPAATTDPYGEPAAQPPVNVAELPAPGAGSKPAPGGQLLQPGG